MSRTTGGFGRWLRHGYTARMKRDLLLKLYLCMDLVEQVPLAQSQSFWDMAEFDGRHHLECSRAAERADGFE